MKQLVCEMCGSKDLVKQDGMFVCQACGTKYSVEEAKKMMIEGTVDVQGTVKVDTTDKLQNLYTLARRAKREENAESAAKYYNEIAVEDPDSWEANFYSTYYTVQQTTIGNIPVAAVQLCNCLQTAFELLCVDGADIDSVRTNIKMIYDDVSALSSSLFVAYTNFFLKFRSDVSTCVSYNAATFAITGILYNFGNLAEKYLSSNTEDIHFALDAWKKGLELRKIYFSKTPVYTGNSKASVEEEVNLYSSKIRKYDQTYNAPTVKGCYVATCVYGSYDCPQVWTLRRFRDYTLAENWYGRAFIKAYYAVSPTLVKWFGHTKWFKRMWKGRLDSMVAKLNAEGVEDTPYQDKAW